MTAKCRGCGEPLAPGDLFGYCAACARGGGDPESG